MHARRKGKSGSIRMIERSEHPSWSSLKPREIESRILDLARTGKSSAEIGGMLRDQYAVPDVKLATGKRISRILKENKMYPEIPEDLKNLISRALKIRQHLESNHKDVHNKRNLQLTESKIRRLVKYYISTSTLPKGWKYRPKEARLMFE
jgi:small subunit ribosomal protein S15